MRNRIRLDTMKDINEFVEIVSGCEGKIVLESSDNLRVNAKSLIGVLASMEFGDIWINSEKDIYKNIERFVII